MILLSKCNQVSDLWQQLEVTFELEPDLRDFVDKGRKRLVDVSAGKGQLVSFDHLNNSGDIDVQVDESVLDGKSSLNMQGYSFFCKLEWGS